jgi:CRISPR/Cas system-associated exonuclease Cas4 (RecB family)
VQATAKACETKGNVYLQAEEARIINQQKIETKKYVHCVSTFLPSEELERKVEHIRNFMGI